MAVFLSEIKGFAASNLSADIENYSDDFEVQGVATKQSWSAGHLAFSTVIDQDLLKRSKQMEHAVLILPKGEGNAGCPCIRVDNPRRAFAQIVERFFVSKPKPGIHPTAIIDGDAQIDPSVSIGPYCVVGPACKIGARTVLHSHVILSRNVEIGEDCVMWSHTVCGDDGFGVERNPGQLQKHIPHLGGVVLGKGVHIGTMSAVAAGTIEPTRIGDGTQLDNHVHVAHNVQIGRNCQLTACVELSGSINIGDNVILGPNSSVIQKIEIGDNAILGIGSVVTKPVPRDVLVAGVPARILRYLPKGDET